MLQDWTGFLQGTLYWVQALLVNLRKVLQANLFFIIYDYFQKVISLFLSLNENTGDILFYGVHIDISTNSILILQDLKLLLLTIISSQHLSFRVPPNNQHLTSTQSSFGSSFSLDIVKEEIIYEIYKWRLFHIRNYTHSLSIRLLVQPAQISVFWCQPSFYVTMNVVFQQVKSCTQIKQLASIKY